MPSNDYAWRIAQIASGTATHLQSMAQFQESIRTARGQALAQAITGVSQQIAQRRMFELERERVDIAREGQRLEAERQKALKPLYAAQARATEAGADVAELNKRIAEIEAEHAPRKAQLRETQAEQDVALKALELRGKRMESVERETELWFRGVDVSDEGAVRRTAEGFVAPDWDRLAKLQRLRNAGTGRGRQEAERMERVDYFLNVYASGEGSPRPTNPFTGEGGGAISAADVRAAARELEKMGVPNDVMAGLATVREAWKQIPRQLQGLLVRDHMAQDCIRNWDAPGRGSETPWVTTALKGEIDEAAGYAASLGRIDDIQPSLRTARTAHAALERERRRLIGIAEKHAAVDQIALLRMSDEEREAHEGEKRDFTAGTEALHEAVETARMDLRSAVAGLLPKGSVFRGYRGFPRGMPEDTPLETGEGPQRRATPAKSESSYEPGEETMDFGEETGAWRWKEGVTEEQKGRAKAELDSVFGAIGDALRTGKAPMPLDELMALGEDASPTEALTRWINKQKGYARNIVERLMERAD